MLIPGSVRRSSLISIRPCQFGELRIAGYQNASLTSGHILGLLEAERSEITKAPDFPRFPGSAMCMRTILNDRESVTSGQWHQSIHISGVTGKVYGDDCFGFGSYCGGCIRWIEIISS